MSLKKFFKKSTNTAISTSTSVLKHVTQPIIQLSAEPPSKEDDIHVLAIQGDLKGVAACISANSTW
jgi:hypothetical protein